MPLHPLLHLEGIRLVSAAELVEGAVRLPDDKEPGVLPVGPPEPEPKRARKARDRRSGHGGEHSASSEGVLPAIRLGESYGVEVLHDGRALLLGVNQVYPLVRLLEDEGLLRGVGSRAIEALRRVHDYAAVPESHFDQLSFQMMDYFLIMRYEAKAPG